MVEPKQAPLLPELLVDVIGSGAYVHRAYGVRLEQDDLVHRLARYNERRALWEFYCEEPFHGDAHVQRESFANVNCVACFSRMPWFRS